MERDTMLLILNKQGGEAAADFNDGESVNGWFGWTVLDGELTITFQPCDDTATPVSRWPTAGNSPPSTGRASELPPSGRHGAGGAPANPRPPRGNGSDEPPDPPTKRCCRVIDGRARSAAPNCSSTPRPTARPPASAAGPPSRSAPT